MEPLAIFKGVLIAKIHWQSSQKICVNLAFLEIELR